MPRSFDIFSPEKDMMAILFRSSYSLQFQVSSMGYLSGRFSWFIKFKSSRPCLGLRPSSLNFSRSFGVLFTRGLKSLFSMYSFLKSSSSRFFE